MNDGFDDDPTSPDDGADGGVIDLAADRALAATRYPIDELVRRVATEPRTSVHGPRGGYLSLIVADLARRAGRPVVVVLPEAGHARALHEAVAGWLPNAPPTLLPPPEISPYAGVAPDRSTTLSRVGALGKAARLGAGEVLVTCALGWSRKSTPAAALAACSGTLRVDGEVDLDKLRAALVAGGYSHVGLVEDEGTFSVRGDIVDVFAPGAPRPVRVELYGDMIESIRTFDPESQRGEADLREYTFGPASEEVLDDGTRATLRRRLGDLAEQLRIPSNRVQAVVRDLQEGVRFFGAEAMLPGFHGRLESVAERLPRNTLVVVFDPDQCAGVVEKWVGARRDEFAREVEHGEIHFPVEEWMVVDDELDASLSSVGPRVDVLRLAPRAVDLAFPCLDNADIVRVRKQRAGGDGAVHAVLDVVERWRDLYGRIVFACSSRSTQERLASLMRAYGAPVRMAHELPDLLERVATPCEAYDVALGSAIEGFRSPALGVAVITDFELLGRSARRAGRAAVQEVATLSSFRELRPGDLVVHVDFGVGRYVDLVRMDAGGYENDFLALDYADGDRLYLPVYRLERVQRYVGSPGGARLDKLGGTTWEKTKERVKKQLADIADELLRIQAERASRVGFRFSPPDDMFAEFEAAFPYEETPHQERAIEEVLADMMGEKPMDRLLCGDVGFGKTEVAIRAAFKAVCDGKQVCVLVPTTVLAEQHGKSFRGRLRHTAARVEVLSRFRTSAETDAILGDLAAGKLDVVVGTHKLLGKEVKFRDLGLLVIDEEQRFGVTHKERIKSLRTTVDVLTMSATPIPRTLEMAMLGVRDMSVILTPPPGRLAVRTHVAKFKDTVVREAIEHELERGGQVYFVHNRVETIYAIAEELQKMIPKARIAVGHAQLRDTELESVMLRFLNRDIDVLVTTTIIESGIDISTANTMFVNEADKFGMSQLHQLRGRIGRGNLRAFCYLLVKDPKKLTPDGRRRLEVLQEHTDLGAGIQIAQQDLDMRGAGNLLGRDQSGHIESVGFELYAELLEEAIADMRGQPTEASLEPEVKVPIGAFIPEHYVTDVNQRLVFYKRYSMARTAEELFDVHGELQERYGVAPKAVEALRDVVLLKIEMRSIGAKKLEAGPKSVVIELLPSTRLNPDSVIAMIQASRGTYEFRSDMTLVRRLKDAEGTDILTAALKVSREVAACA
ncbi:MAG: transcription-repair coupling factor [Myxococcales bacterium]|nr:transcription-repair coupling factor [Myxococcales bacterium]MCB9531175.1 transcription-repair coupling factor [Myxococcales bacterium]